MDEIRWGSGLWIIDPNIIKSEKNEIQMFSSSIKWWDLTKITLKSLAIDLSERDNRLNKNKGEIKIKEKQLDSLKSNCSDSSSENYKIIIL